MTDSDKLKALREWLDLMTKAFHVNNAEIGNPVRNQTHAGAKWLADFALHYLALLDEE